ncbi:21706_t:CDS:2, partial [Dentiscutata erythropus]
MENVYDPRYVLPNYKYIRKVTISRFETWYKLIAEELENLTTKVALTMDTWKSSADQPMLNTTDILLKSSYPSISDVCLVLKATILDTASKLIIFPTSKRERAITSLKNIIAQYAPPELVTGATSTSTSTYNEKRQKFMSLVMQQTTELQTIGKVTEQLETYLSSPIIANGSDPLQCIPCKEAFFTASRTISKLRNHLNPETAH